MKCPACGHLVLGPLDGRTLAESQGERIRKALEFHEGRVASAARMLGISRATVYRWKQKELKRGKDVHSGSDTPRP